MAHSDLAFRRARRAYELAHVSASVRGLVVAAGLTALAIGLDRATSVTWLVAATLAATLAVLGWLGGAWRRGALAGVVAGLPPLIAPSLVMALGHSGHIGDMRHCADCASGPSLACIVTCFGTGSLVGIVAGYRATLDASPRRFALGAIASAALTGLLSCGTTGLGGASGVVIGLVAGGVTGWLVAGRTARA
jgi:hypothetical protein